MSISKKINLIIYRFKEKGLEIFLENNGGNEAWETPSCEKELDSSAQLEYIELDPVTQMDGKKEDGWAVEGDWHDIPSLKEMIFEDALFLKDKIKEMEKGAFFSFKEALKKVLPHQYQLLKELKDILTDRNSIKDI